MACHPQDSLWQPFLTSTIQQFCQDVGLTQIFADIQSGLSVSHDVLVQLDNGQEWSVGRQGYSHEDDDDNNDLHWIEVANEATFEQVVTLLKKAGLDEVLETLGDEFRPNSWTLLGSGLGFLVTLYCDQQELSEVTVMDNVVTLQFPLLLPPPNHQNDTAQLHFLQQDGHQGLVDFDMNVAMVIPPNTAHTFGQGDFSQNKSVALICTVWLADITQESVETLAYADASYFPVIGDVDYLWFQRGRFWRHGGASLKNDTGQKLFVVEDYASMEYCEARAQKGYCDDFVTNTRQECPKTCNVYLEDEVYHKFLYSDSRDCSAAKNKKRQPTLVQRSVSGLKRFFCLDSEDDIWLNAATDDIDWLNVYGISLMLAALLITKRGAVRHKNQYLNNALYLLAVFVRYAFRFGYLYSPSIYTSIVQSYEIYTVVHPVTSNAIVLVHPATGP